MANKYQMTQKDLDAYKEELNYLVTDRRTEVIALIEHARSLGDLSENSEYDEAREEQGKLETRIEELKDLIKNADIIDETNIDTDSVNIGFRVKVRNLTKGGEKEYEIVGSTAAAPLSGKISNQSPIGMALIGSKVGDKVVAHCPAQDIELEVLEAEKID